MRESLQLALQPSVVRRALKFAVVVGVVLITINHGHAIVDGEVTRERLLQMGLTVLVPYVVSTFSSVQAIRDVYLERGVTRAGSTAADQPASRIERDASRTRN